MAIPIPGPLVEYLLLGPQDDRRQLQDTPILGDVWAKYAEKPNKRIDLLITPHRSVHPGELAGIIDDGLDDPSGDDPAQVAPIQGIIAARLTFEELLRVVLPKTKWWHTGRLSGNAERAVPDLDLYTATKLKGIVERALKAARGWFEGRLDRQVSDVEPTVDPDPEREPLHRHIVLAGLTLWASDMEPESGPAGSPAEQALKLVGRAKPKPVADRLARVIKQMGKAAGGDPLVWQVSVNRSALPALNRSIPAVKADAAKTLFGVSCKKLAWAVLDSGIDGNHVAFADAAGKSRVRASYDFRDLRRIVSLGNSRPATRQKNVEKILADGRLASLPAKAGDVDDALSRLAENARNKRPLDWGLVEKFVKIKPETPPNGDHGTHVAGIIAASRTGALAAAAKKKAADVKDIEAEAADGMCPDIGLYDFRVLSADLKETEFAIISALQFIRHLNDQDPKQAINGANLSLSIPHDVRNYACGRTPVCDECERLVASGVVVVAAAGNHGYKSFETADGSPFDGYAAFSITDPGNADTVITVGSTHRSWPHTYGVSYFSSRGPTGDGRVKPDLVAPGERIRAPFQRDKWGDLDGTSMAAPHVSGAAAMLLARYSELIGRPRRVKQVLCDTATDLGRERTFQGRGMLDVLRALQSV